MWKLLHDLHGTRFEITLYLVEGGGYLLIDNAIISKYRILNYESVIIIRKGTEGLSDSRPFLLAWLHDENRSRGSCSIEMLPFLVLSGFSVYATVLLNLARQDDEICFGGST